MPFFALLAAFSHAGLKGLLGLGEAAADGLKHLIGRLAGPNGNLSQTVLGRGLSEPFGLEGLDELFGRDRQTLGQFRHGPLLRMRRGRSG